MARVQKASRLPSRPRQRNRIERRIMSKFTIPRAESRDALAAAVGDKRIGRGALLKGVLALMTGAKAKQGG